MTEHRIRYRDLLIRKRREKKKIDFKIFVSLLPLSVIRRAFEIYFNENDKKRS